MNNCILCANGVPLDSSGREHRVNPAHGETFVGPCSEPWHPKTEMTSLREIKSRLAAIEHVAIRIEQRIEALAIEQPTKALIAAEHQSLQLYIKGWANSMAEKQMAMDQHICTLIQELRKPKRKRK